MSDYLGVKQLPFFSKGQLCPLEKVYLSWACCSHLLIEGGEGHKTFIPSSAYLTTPYYLLHTALLLLLVASGRSLGIQRGMGYMHKQLHLAGYRESLIPAGLRLTRSFLWQGGALQPPGKSLVLQDKLWHNCASVCPWSLKRRDICCLSFCLGKNISNICLRMNIIKVRCIAEKDPPSEQRLP